MTDRERIDAAFDAVSKDDISELNALLDSGVSASAVVQSPSITAGLSLLMCAAHHENPEICEYLINCGAKVDAQYVDLRTALMFACETDSIRTVRCLVSHGCNLELKDCDGWTALNFAINFAPLQSSPLLIPKFLVANGASIDVVPRNTANEKKIFNTLYAIKESASLKDMVLGNMSIELTTRTDPNGSSLGL